MYVNDRKMNLLKYCSLKHFKLSLNFKILNFLTFKQF